MYRRWFDEPGAMYALQRPDFYVYGTGTNAVDASALLTDLQRHLQPADQTLEGARP